MTIIILSAAIIASWMALGLLWLKVKYLEERIVGADKDRCNLWHAQPTRPGMVPGPWVPPKTERRGK